MHGLVPVAYSRFSYFQAKKYHLFKTIFFLCIDPTVWLRNLEIGTQFQESENAQRNLEIAQIPKLRGTYIHIHLERVWLVSISTDAP